MFQSRKLMDYPVQITLVTNAHYDTITEILTSKKIQRQYGMMRDLVLCFPCYFLLANITAG